MSNFEKEQYDKASYIISSKCRRIVYDELLDSPKTPLSIPLDEIHTSRRAIQELREQNIVELLVTEDDRKYRYYGVTDEDKELRTLVKILQDD